MKKLFVLVTISAIVLLSFSVEISSVEFQGLENVKKEELLELLKPYIGEDIDTSQLFSELSSMRAVLEDTGYFSSIRTRLDEDENGNYKVIFIVKENPVIEKIDIVQNGPKLVDETLISSEVTLKEGEVLNTKKLQETLANIHKLYSDAGYLLVEIKPVLKPATHLTIEITEYGVWDIEFRGADDERIPLKELKKQLNFQTLKDYYNTWLLFRWFMDKKKSYPKLEDIQRMMSFLSQKIYFKDARVKPVPAPKEELDKYNVKDKAVNLVFYVTLREVLNGRIRVKEVKVRGNDLVSKNEIVKAADITGREVDNIEILKAAQRILDLYNTKGYMMTWLDITAHASTVEFDIYEKYVRDVIYEFISGDGNCKVYIDAFTGKKTKVEGCEFNHTRKYLVDDLFTIKRGDPLSQIKLADSFGSLNRSNYFEKVDLVPLGSKDATQVDLLVKINEKEKKFQFMGAVSWGPPGEGREWYEGFGGQLSISTVNPAGLGQSASLKLNLGLSKKSIDVDYSIPRPFMIPMRFGIGGSFSYENDTDSSTSTISGKVSLSTLPIFNNTFSVYYVHSLVLPNSAKSKAGIIHNFDTRDSSINPTKGLLIYEKYERGGLFQGEEDVYNKVLGGVRVYFPIYWKFFGALKAFGGAVFNEKGTEKITPFPSESVRGQDISGVYSYRLDAELRYSVYKYPIPVNVVLFYDMGKGVDSFDALNDFIYSAGIGLELGIPMLGKIELGGAYKYPEDKFDIYVVFGAQLYGGMP